MYIYSTSFWGPVIPQSFIIPAQIEELKKYERDYPQAMRSKGKIGSSIKKPIWIVKPSNSNNGHGIELIENSTDLRMTKDVTIVQEYIQNPFLINGHKFDMRLYVLITSFDPLMIYLYGDGLVRFATQPFSTDPSMINNKFAHLTNFEINKVRSNLESWC